MKTSELTGKPLDWAVAKACGLVTVEVEGVLHLVNTRGQPSINFNPSTNWSQGGPIIEQHRITISALFAQINPPIPDFDKNEWGAYIPYGTTERGMGAGPTPLIAAMRCLIASKLGDEIEIPEELP